MTLSIVLQFLVVLAAIWMGARYSGVGLGLWGAVGLLVLVVAFGVNPTSPPIDVMLIILAVIMAASVMDAAGGIDFLVRIAERIIRANPKYVTIVAPLTTWSFTFLAGTGHIVYPLLPVIYETAHQSGIAGLGMYALKLYYDTEESREGVNALKDKRKPDFRKYAK